MPAVRRYQPLTLAGWPSGLNVDADTSRLQPDELSAALNTYIGPRGEAGIRAGYTRFDDGSMNGFATFLYPWRTPNGTDYLVAVDEFGVIRYGASPSFSDAGITVDFGTSISNYGVGFASAFSKLYISSKEATAVVSWDGSTWTNVGGMPIAKQLWFRHGRMFAINDNARPSGVYFSELNQPEVFAVEDYLEINPDDGYQINASVVFGDDLVLFKDNAIWKLSGRTPSSFAVYEIDSHRGSVSPRAFAQLRGRLFFFDRDTGVWAFDGAGFELVSEPINQYLLDGQNYSQGFRASMYASDDRVFVSIPWGTGDDRRQFVYSGDNGAWTEWDSGFGGRTDYLDTRYVGLPQTNGIWYADADSSFDLETNPIAANIRTGWFLIGGPGADARIRRLEMTFKGPVTTSGTINMYVDYNEDTPTVTRTFVGGPAPSQHAVQTDERRVAIDGWGPRLHAVMFEFLTTDRPFQINDMTIFFTGGVDLRGDR